MEGKEVFDSEILCHGIIQKVSEGKVWLVNEEFNSAWITDIGNIKFIPRISREMPSRDLTDDIPF